MPNPYHDRIGRFTFKNAATSTLTPASTASARVNALLRGGRAVSGDTGDDGDAFLFGKPGKSHSPYEPAHEIRAKILALGSRADAIRDRMHVVDTLLIENGNKLFGADGMPRDMNGNTRNAINRRSNKLQLEYSDLYHEQLGIRDSMLFVMSHSDSRADIYAHADTFLELGKPSRDQLSTINHTINDINGLIGPATGIERMSPGVCIRPNGRANYNDSANQRITLRSENDAGTIAHELGHFLDSQNEGMARRAENFWNDRINRYYKEQNTKGRSYDYEYLKLKDLHPERGYDDDEEVMPDHFGHAYTGKVYGGKYHGHQITEITSMGLEQLFTDPLKFARDDPDHFDFMIETLAGYNRYAELDEWR